MSFGIGRYIGYRLVQINTLLIRLKQTMLKKNLFNKTIQYINFRQNQKGESFVENLYIVMSY